MHFHKFTIASAVAAFAVLAQTSQAAECTKDQLQALEKLQDEDVMDKACPDTDDGSGSFDFEKMNPKAWATISPCANTTCVSYLKTQVTKVPNCEIKQVNIQKHYNDKLALCIDIASGKLSAAEIEKRLDGFGDDSDEWFGSGSGEVRSADDDAEVDEEHDEEDNDGHDEEHGAEDSGSHDAEDHRSLEAADNEDDGLEEDRSDDMDEHDEQDVDMSEDSGSDDSENHRSLRMEGESGSHDEEDDRSEEMEDNNDEHNEEASGEHDADDSGSEDANGDSMAY